MKSKLQKLWNEKLHPALEPYLKRLAKWKEDNPSVFFALTFAMVVVLIAGVVFLTAAGIVGLWSENDVVNDAPVNGVVNDNDNDVENDNDYVVDPINGNDEEPVGPEFEVYNLSVPSTVGLNVSFNITAQVENVGDEEGVYTLVLKVDGEQVGSTSGTVSAGESVSVSFEHSEAEAGSYTVEVNGETRTFVVEEAEPPVDPPPIEVPEDADWVSPKVIVEQKGGTE